MRRSPFCMLVVLAAAGLGGPVSTSEACCNALPVVARDYQSTLGSVRERLAAPGHAVTITRKWCDTLGGAQPPFFDPVAGNNVVTIAFNPPAGGSGGTKTTTGLSSRQCDRSGNCVDCPPSSPFPCNTLTFTMPDTDADLPPADGDGWTGPATITVTAGGSTVAKIDRLFRPSDGCDCGDGKPAPECSQGDEVFMQFTVLPTPNDFQSLATGRPLRMALDGGGNLLVPIHHPATAYATPGLGQWERGVGTFCAVKPAASDPSCSSSPKMAKVLATAAPGTLQAFTISGERVAPIFDHDDKGALYGTSDVEYSVLWVERSAQWDLLHRIKNGTGPIRIDKSGAGAGSQFDLTACLLAKLISLRTADGVLANVDGNGEVQIYERARAGEDCGTDTGLVPDDVDLGVATDLALEAEGSVVAFLKQGGPTVEVFSATGKRLTPAQLQTATTAWRVNDHALAVEDPLAGDLTTDSLVYFFDPTPKLRTFNRTTKKFEDVAPANAAAAAGQRAVTQPPTGSAQAHRYPWSTSANHSTLGLSATELAIAGDLIAAAATGGTVKVWPWPAGSPPPPPNRIPLDSGVATDQSLGIASACTSSGCTRLVVNGKKTTGDHELRIFSFDPGTGSLQDTTLKAAAEDFIVGDRLVAFRTRESAGNDLNNDGDTTDVVMRLIAFDSSPPYTPHVFETGWPAVGWNDKDAPWNVLGWRTPYRAVGDDVFFVTRECDQHGTVVDTLCPSGGTDLNRDGDADDLVLQIYHHGSKTVNAVAAVGTGPVEILSLSNGLSVQVAGSGQPEDALADAAADVAPLCAAQAGAAQVDVPPAAGTATFSLPGPKGGIVVGDGDQDGVLDGFDNCETASNPAQFDDDRDGMGDRSCDPTYCTDFTPPAIAARGRLAPATQRAAFRYFMQLARPKASLSCLERIVTGELTGDPETLCRGSFVADVENLPFDEKTAAVERRLQLAFLDVLDKRGDLHMLTADQTQAFRRLIRSFGESFNAATRVAYGQVEKLPPGPERDFQINLGRQSVRYLETLVAAMSDCVDQRERRADAAHCLGRIEGGRLLLPDDPKTAARIRSATDALRAAADDHCDGCILAKLDTCASDDRHELDCPVCTSWRNAVEVIESVYGRASAEPCRLLARAARK